MSSSNPTIRSTLSRIGWRETTTADAPWPVGLLAAKIGGYIDRLGTAWVEGEITQWSVSGGTVYGKLKDLEQDATISFSVWSSVRARIPKDLKQGDRVIALIKPNYWIKGGTLTMQVYEMRHVGLGDLLERLERLRATLAAEGLLVRADGHCQGSAGETTSSVRVSLHAYSTEAEVDRLLAALAALDG